MFLVNAQTNAHTLESRQLRFWFRNSINDAEQNNVAQNFFRDLINPDSFPRDYVGYIMKIMKQMQHNKYAAINQMEVEMKQVQELSELPQRPSELTIAHIIIALPLS